MNELLLIDILGWVGGITLLTAFGLNSLGKISSNSRIYQLMNLTAAIFLIINSYYHGAFPLVFVNVSWLVIAVWSLFKGSTSEQS